MDNYDLCSLISSLDYNLDRIATALELLTKDIKEDE